jgi:hypothetical protein
MSASSLSHRQYICLALGILGSALVLVAFMVLPFYSFTLGGQVVGPRTGAELWLQLLQSGPFFLVISLIPGTALLILCLSMITAFTSLPRLWYRVYLIALISGTAALLFQLLLLRLLASLAMGSVVILIGYGIMWIGWSALR